MIRKSCIPHGTDEVLVVFEVDGEIRNHLLRKAPELRERYAEHEASAKVRRESFEQEVASERSVIDADAFAAAEKEIADA
ncbi:MAG: hypothetical protein WD825_17420 [Gemmatimonadaceae bacterium]